MKIQLLGTISGTRNGQEWPPRLSIIELPDAEALSLIQGEMARPVDDEPTIELATVSTDDVETRAMAAPAIAEVVSPDPEPVTPLVTDTGPATSTRIPRRTSK